MARTHTCRESVPNVVVLGAQTVAELGIMQFLNGYWFLLLSHGPREWGSLGVGPLQNSQDPLSPLILTLFIDKGGGGSRCGGCDDGGGGEFHCPHPYIICL